MASANGMNVPGSTMPAESTSSWTYPTRTCRLCLEEVPATVTMYPPGLPPSFQRPIVEYKNDDEYGRLIKPCHCRGGMRYIHELCLLRSRIEGVRPGSLWKCHECGYQFNFQRLTVQRYLSSKVSSGVLTVVVMLVIMFLLGFVADPIINLFVDPYETLMGNEYYWQTVDVNDSHDRLPNWAQHFLKGLVSMGLVGFLKTTLLNPFHSFNFRNTGLVTGRVSGRLTIGRDRVVNISWIAILIGIASAFYFFYQRVQTIIGRALQWIGNNIVDTQLPGDDDDLKPPPGFKVAATPSDAGVVSNDEHPITEPVTKSPPVEGKEQGYPPVKGETRDDLSAGLKLPAVSFDDKPDEPAGKTNEDAERISSTLPDEPRPGLRSETMAYSSAIDHV